MTMQDLKKYRWLRREIGTLRQKLAMLEADTKAPSSRRPESQPIRGSRRDRMTEYIIHTEELRRIIGERERAATAELESIERFISSVPDSLDRQILSHRFVDGYSWTRTAHALGGGNTPEGVRKRAQRAMRDTQGGAENRAAKK